MRRLVLVGAIGAVAAATIGGIHYAFAQTSTVFGTTFNDVTALVTAVGVALGAIAAVLSGMVPWVKKLNQKAAADIGKVADALVQTDHRVIDAVTTAKSHEPHIEALWNAIKIGLSAEDQAKIDKIQQEQVQPKVQQITAAIDNTVNALDKAHDALPTTGS